MLENPQEMRLLTNDLGVAVWTATAIGALYESGLAEHLREPRSIDELASRCRSLSRGQIERCLAVAETAGVVVADGPQRRLAPGALAFVQQPMNAALTGEIRSNLMQAVAFLDASRAERERPTTGWTHADPALLQAQGDSSAVMAFMMKMQVLPALEGLGERLERPGARFLDVGAGVGGLAIAMCRAFPQLSILGVDVLDTPLAIAKKNVTNAGLVERIELRKQAVEDLREESAFDAAWLPGFFVPTAAAAATRIHAALRPGGWLLFGVAGWPADPKRRAVWSLINELWGGVSSPPAEGEAILREAGFSVVRTLPGPEWAPSLVVGQR